EHREQGGQPGAGGQQAVAQPGRADLEQFDTDKPGHRDASWVLAGGRPVSLRNASSRSPPAVRSARDDWATNRPRSRIRTESTVCATSARMWLDTRTVQPSAARPR